MLAMQLFILQAFGLACVFCASDTCCDCLSKGTSCAQACISKSRECQDCINYGGTGCASQCGCHWKRLSDEAAKYFKGVNASDDMIFPEERASDQNCEKPGDCGRAYQSCCWAFARKGFPCGCHLQDGTGVAGSSCGDCGDAFVACCVGFKAKGFPCTCDVEPAPVSV
mmetsp:Transcript_78706/g.148503  ORF Transcript_78706/g.148503 Transcript_78706/m.148503 type:complete len:168 (+) Transcript_78706:56-559(+)